MKIPGYAPATDPNERSVYTPSDLLAVGLLKVYPALAGHVTLQGTLMLPALTGHTL